MNFDITPLINDIKIPITSIDLELASRDLRNRILRDHVDSINPIRYESLTDEQRAELKTYRQALLDVPQQQGWPTNFSWPTKPTWM